MGNFVTLVLVVLGIGAAIGIVEMKQAGALSKSKSVSQTIQLNYESSEKR